MKPRPALYLLAALLFTGISPAQPTDGTVASQAVDTTGTGIDTDQERSAFRTTLRAQSAEIGLLDRFNNTARYPDGSTFTSSVTLPEIGSAWRLSVPPGTTAPTITGRAVTPHADSLYYLGTSIPSRNGKFSLGFEFTAATGNPTWTNRIGLNISFNDETMIPADGSGIFPSAGGGVVHINFSDTGIVNTAGFFGGALLTCVDATANGGNIYEWSPGYTGMVADQRYTLLLEVEGDYLRITLVGVGSLLFHHPDLSDHVGASTTNFWWEANGATLGTDYRLVPLLHKAWSSEALDQLPAFGSRPVASPFSQISSTFGGRMKVMGHQGATWSSGNEPTTADDYLLSTPRKMRADQGFYVRPYANQADYPVPLTCNLVNTELASSAGASNTSLLSLADFPMTTTGDYVENEVIGSFAANNNAKGVQLYVGTYNTVVATTGSITTNGGTWRARLIRRRLATRSHDYYGEISITSGATTTVYTGRLEQSNGTLATTPQLRVSGVAAGDVKIQHGKFMLEFHP